MTRVLRICMLVMFIFSSEHLFAAGEDMFIKSVVKLTTYEYSKVTDNYVPISYGSAVYIGDGRLLTNAHVILGSDEQHPTGLYEVCYSQTSSKPPICSSGAKLIQYDLSNDLALLEIPKIQSNKGIKPAPTSASIGSKVIIYGYPAIGGTTITRTEGKIAGSERETLKIDAIIDRGNSGGGAFDEKGNLVGIPYASVTDTSTIGYVIPMSKVMDFLSGKTKSTQFTSGLDAGFSSYISKIHSFLKKPKIINDGILTIQGAENIDSLSSHPTVLGIIHPCAITL